MKHKLNWLEHWYKWFLFLSMAQKSWWLKICLWLEIFVRHLPRMYKMERKLWSSVFLTLHSKKKTQKKQYQKFSRVEWERLIPLQIFCGPSKHFTDIFCNFNWKYIWIASLKIFENSDLSPEDSTSVLRYLHGENAVLF